MTTPLPPSIVKQFQKESSDIFKKKYNNQNDMKFVIIG